MLIPTNDNNMKTFIKQKLLVCIALITCCLTSLAQDRFYINKAEVYLREAEELSRKAEVYIREATYYNKAKDYLREADYCSKHQKPDKARSYVQQANEAIEKSQTRTKWANEARENMQLRMRWSKDAFEKAKK